MKAITIETIESGNQTEVHIPIDRTTKMVVTLPTRIKDLVKFQVTEDNKQPTPRSKKNVS